MNYCTTNSEICERSNFRQNCSGVWISQVSESFRLTANHILFCLNTQILNTLSMNIHKQENKIVWRYEHRVGKERICRNSLDRKIDKEKKELRKLLFTCIDQKKAKPWLNSRKKQSKKNNNKTTFQRKNPNAYKK